MTVFDLDKCPLSDRNSTYYGMAGQKEGIMFQGNPWIVKYPKSTAGMRGERTSYTTAPLSEYIGSHVYSILGYPVHETILGIRNEKLVVACRDFCDTPGQLVEFRGFKNVYNRQLEEILETELSSTGSERYVELPEILVHLQYNPSINQVSGVTQRFWDCIIVDGFINNNDRNNGNWGFLRTPNGYTLAPVYDNGAAFSNKATDATLQKKLQNIQNAEASALNGVTIYSKNGTVLTFKNLLKECLPYKDFGDAVKRTVPLIQKSMPEIRSFMKQLPESYRGVSVCSAVRRAVYMQDMELRLEKLLLPTLEKVRELSTQQEQGVQQSVLEKRISDASTRAAEINSGKNNSCREALTPEHN